MQKILNLGKSEIVSLPVFLAMILIVGSFWVWLKSMGSYVLELI